MARTSCFVCYISTVNGCSKKKKRKEEAYPWKTGTSSGHIANLKQPILETFDIYDYTCSSCFLRNYNIVLSIDIESLQN
jgi:hypothetical protein